MDPKYNHIMPESEGNVLCLEIADKVSLEAYANVLEPAFKRIITEYGDIRGLLFYKGSFPAWDVDAASQDLHTLSQVGQKIKKLALVNPPEQALIKWQTLKPLLGGELKFFTSENLEEALKWVKL